MSGSKRGKQRSKQSDRASTKSSIGASASSSDLREFLYLDFPKITSYLAQIDEGNIRTRKEYRGYSERELARDNTVETSVAGGAGGSVDANPLGPDLGNLNLGKFLNLIGRIDANVTRLVRSGGDEYELNNARYQVAVKEIHHEAFRSVESHLAEKDLIADGVADRHGKPFLRITGLAEIVDFSVLADSVEQYDDFGETFSALTGEENFAEGGADKASLAKLLRKFYGGRLGVAVHHGGRSVTAYLDRAHFTADAQFITDNYGRFTQVPITLFGLQIGKAYPMKETSGQTQFLESIPGDVGDPGFGQMALQLLKANRAMEGIDRFFRIRGDVHVYPIAVFLHL